MRQTVLGVYDSYDNARFAQRALGDEGVAQADIAIYSMSAQAPVENGPRVYAPGGAAARHHAPVFDQLERLFERLFEGGDYPPETEDYRELIRRGGAIVSADVSEMQVDLVRDVMRRAGAADIEERTRAWRNESAAGASELSLHRGSSTVHEPSGLQQDSIRAGDTSRTGDGRVALPGEGRRSMPSAAGSTQAYAVPEDVPPVIEARTAAASDTPFTDSDSEVGTVSGMQQVTTRTVESDPARSVERQQQRMSGVPDMELPRTSAGVAEDLKSRPVSSADNGASASQIQRTSSAGLVGDPIMGTPLDDGTYEDEFRRDYDSHYANTGAPYDDYRRAYTHGATLGQDDRYRVHDWQEVESSAREHWESRYPESGWERFKAAVRHGWERVKGQ